MKRERIHPVTRTFNTLMIACNTSYQWQVGGGGCGRGVGGRVLMSSNHVM